MLALGFSERLVGGLRRAALPDELLSVELSARRARLSRATRWEAQASLSLGSGALRSPAILLRGTVQHEADRLRYSLSGADYALLGEKQLLLRDLYAGLSTWRGRLERSGRLMGAVWLRVDLRGDWRFCLRHLELGLWRQQP